MVDTGIVQKLLELLNRHVEEGNVTVQHAALSALRNLAIPGEASASVRHRRACGDNSKCVRLRSAEDLR